MDEFLQIASGWPTAVFSLLLVAALTFWMVGLVSGGLEEIELDLDVDLDPGAEAAEGGFGAIMSFLHLDGAPLALSLSFWALFSWFTSYMSVSLLGSADGSLGSLAGALVIPGALAAGLLPTAMVVRPVARVLSRLVAPAMTNAELVGNLARVTTARVDRQFGQAEVLLPDGTRPRVAVRSGEEGIVADDVVLLVEHEADEEAYTVVHAPAALGGRAPTPPAPPADAEPAPAPLALPRSDPPRGEPSTP